MTRTRPRPRPRPHPHLTLTLALTPARTPLLTPSPTPSPSPQPPTLAPPKTHTLRASEKAGAGVPPERAALPQRRKQGGNRGPKGILVSFGFIFGLLL